MDTTRQTNDQDLVRTLVAQIFDRVMAVQHLQQPIDLTSSPFKEPALKKRKKEIVPDAVKKKNGKNAGAESKYGKNAGAECRKTGQGRKNAGKKCQAKILKRSTDRRQAGEAIKINLLKNGDDEIKPLTPGVLFPRELKEGEKPNQRAFARWLRKPVPVAAQRQVLVPNPTWKRSNEKCDFEVIGNNEHFPPQTSKKFPNYSLLTPAAALLTNQGSVGWYAPQTLENSSRQLPPLPRPEQIQPEDLDFDPLTPDEAEQLLRELLGNKFDDIAAQLPTKAQGAFVSAEQFNELQIGVTWSYEIDPRSGKVSSIFMQWNWVGGPIADITHAYDIYLAECGLV